MIPPTAALTVITVSAALMAPAAPASTQIPQSLASFHIATVPQFVVAESDRQIEAICALRENWDGYGGTPLHVETQENVRAALRAFQLNGPVPDLTPNPNGTVSFEWSSTRGDAHVEFGRTRYVGVIRPTGSDYIPVIGTTDGDLAAALKSLAHVIKAALFPTETPALTPIRFLVGNAVISA